jgi:hypothetical protein
LNVYFEAKSNDFGNKLCRENPDKDYITDVKDLGLLVALIVTVKRKSNCVCQDEAVDEKIEGHRCHNEVEDSQETVFAGSGLCNRILFLLFHQLEV